MGMISVVSDPGAGTRPVPLLTCRLPPPVPGLWGLLPVHPGNEEVVLVP